MKNSKKKSILIQYVVIMIAMIFFIFPIVWMILTSFKTQNDAFTTVPKWVFHVTFDNYKAVLFDKDFLKYLGNSLYVTVFSTLLAVILGGGIAYPYARYNLKVQKIY